MPQHEAKRQRLEQLLGAKRITHAALATLLREIDSAPVESASRWTLGNVLKKRCLGSGILIRRATICFFVFMSFRMGRSVVKDFPAKILTMRCRMVNGGRRRRPLSLHARPLSLGDACASLQKSFATAFPTRRFIQRDKAYVQARRLRMPVPVRFDDVGTVITLRFLNGGTFDWEVIRLDKAFNYLSSRSDFFRTRLERAMRESKGMLDFAFYCDEVVPGDPIVLDVTRKFWAFYASVVQFGNDLQREELWLPLAVLRTKVSTKIHGGMSACFAELVKMTFEAPVWLSRGLVIDLPEPVLVRGRFGMFIADGDAERATWTCKGAAGVRPCFKCQNVVKERHARADGLVDMGCPDTQLFQMLTDEDVYNTVDILQETQRHATQEDFEDIEKALGMVLVPGSLLTRADIRHIVAPASTHRYDAMHCLLHNGVVGYEMGRLLHEIVKLRPAFNYPLIVNYIRSGWACPGVIADSMGSLVRIAERVFMTRRQHLLKKFEIKASASDLMAMAPLFRVIVDETVKPFGLEALIKPIRSFDACMEVLDCYIAIKRGETVLNFQACMENFMTCHGDAYGRLSFKPKHHWSMHLPLQYEEDGMLVDTFVLERKHKMLLSCGHDIGNTTRFERTVAVNSLIMQATTLGKCKASGLQEPVTQCLTLTLAFGAAVQVSSGMRAGATYIRKGDVVFLAGVPVDVQACAQQGNDLYVIGEAFELAEQLSRTCSVWRPTDGVVVGGPKRGAR